MKKLIGTLIAFAVLATLVVGVSAFGDSRDPDDGVDIQCRVEECGRQRAGIPLPPICNPSFDKLINGVPHTCVLTGTSGNQCFYTCTANS